MDCCGSIGELRWFWMGKLLSTLVGQIYWAYSNGARQRTILYQNEDLETSACAWDMTGIPSFKSQFKNQEAWCYLVLFLLWVSRLLQTMLLPYIFLPFTSVKVWELQTGTNLRMKTWRTKPYKSTTPPSPTAVGHAWTWSEGQAGGVTPEESALWDFQLHPTPNQLCKTIQTSQHGNGLGLLHLGPPEYVKGRANVWDFSLLHPPVYFCKAVT